MITIQLGGLSVTITPGVFPPVEEVIGLVGEEDLFALASRTTIQGSPVRWVGVNAGIWAEATINNKWYLVRAETTPEFITETLLLVWRICLSAPLDN